MTLRGARNGLALGDTDAPVDVIVVADPSTDPDRVVALLADRFPGARLRVQTERGPEAGLARLARERFDLVVVDVSRSLVDGSSVASAVRAGHPGTPLMVVTDGGRGLDLWARVDDAKDLAAPGRPAPDLATAIVDALRGNRAEAGAMRYLDLARGLLDALDAPTCAVDAESRIVAVNLAWRDFARDNGGTEEVSEVGVSYLDICERADSDPRSVWTADAAIVARGIREVLAGGLELFSHDYACHSPSEKRWFRVRVTPAAINGGLGAVITHLNMTDLREIEQTLAHRSMHDPLTGLPNRALLVDRLEQAANDADRRGLGVAVAHVDLTNFQRVNDTLQYGCGDTVLVQVAHRLRSQLRRGDTLARASGDEFLVVWRDLSMHDPQLVVSLAQGLVDALEAPFGADVPVLISASVGVARHVAGQDVARTLQSAGLALADAKSRGARSVALFTPELEEAVTVRTTLEMDLRLALSGAVTQFVVHYQPVVDLATGDVVAVESLVRWEHPVLGVVGPGRFVPMAEAAGLVHELGAWVLQQAVRDAPRLTHRGRELDIAVNFSVLQLDERMVPKMQQTLVSGGLRAGRLIVEVTESALAEDEDAVVRTLEALSALGVNVAIDDFGTGYSSLHNLRRYPIDTIKIDREFVAGIGKPADDEAICESVVRLAEAVGAGTIGEGVETAEQYAFLRSIGCQQGQGYLWSTPVPIDQLGAALAACAEVPVATVRAGAPRPADVRIPPAATIGPLADGRSR
jgi:diguanylate cyclase (GGDEF)-like protein